MPKSHKPRKPRPRKAAPTAQLVAVPCNDPACGVPAGYTTTAPPASWLNKSRR